MAYRLRALIDGYQAISISTSARIEATYLLQAMVVVRQHGNPSRLDIELRTEGKRHTEPPRNQAAREVAVRDDHDVAGVHALVEVLGVVGADGLDHVVDARAHLLDALAAGAAVGPDVEVGFALLDLGGLEAFVVAWGKDVSTEGKGMWKCSP